MVEKNTNATTQLPVTTQVEKILMHGTPAQFKQAIKGLLEEVPMNDLENMLLDKHLNEPAECAPKITDLLNKVKSRLEN
jgi:hypothetical protein